MKEQTLICVIGTIGAGKTTILQHVQHIEGAGVAVVSIDDFREEFTAFLAYLEAEAWKGCIEVIRELAARTPVILECSGTGRYFDEIVTEFPGRVYIVRLRCELEEIYHRIRRRYRIGYKWPPVSWSTDPFTVARRQFDLLEVMPVDLIIDTGRETVETCVQSVIDLVRLVRG